MGIAHRNADQRMEELSFLTVVGIRRFVSAYQSPSCGGLIFNTMEK